jgi:hypothetical protein
MIYLVLLGPLVLVVVIALLIYWPSGRTLGDNE